MDSYTSDLVDIEPLLVELSDESSTAAGLMREHLWAARFYLLGSMPKEYALSLKLADRVLPDIKDAHLRVRIATFLKRHHLKSSLFHSLKCATSF